MQRNLAVALVLALPTQLSVSHALPLHPRATITHLRVSRCPTCSPRTFTAVVTRARIVNVPITRASTPAARASPSIGPAAPPQISNEITSTGTLRGLTTPGMTRA